MSGDNTQQQPTKTPPTEIVTPPPPAGQWEFKTDQGAEQSPAPFSAPIVPQESVEWSASEFITHQKTAVWYLILAVSSIALSGLVFLLTRGDKITSIAILVAAVFLGVVAARKPRVLDYQVSNAGINIGTHFYPYESFKSFSIQHEGAFSSISFMPLKRFMPLVTMYYSPDEEEKVLAMLSTYLPVEPARRDMLDNFLERIRF